ncbi:glycosyltransferase family 2 protein [Ekhidna sp.]|uniref:glycosyltransferase family 2 protein n=1 Tax=Ekhidna sp. TaxID=2608089 RepID=UPI003C7DA0B3
MEPLVSIIIAVFNGEKYIREAIESALNQSYSKIELLIIDDGSKDNTVSIIDSFVDNRIKLFKLVNNQGVSNARNVGLHHMKGDYFCFLDADDMLPSKSIESRLEVFKKSKSITFVDGVCEKFNHDFSLNTHTWHPAFKGNPLRDLIRLSGFSFFALTWLIKREPISNYRFDPNLTHGEDLLFFMQLARNQDAEYDFTEERVLHYRVHSESAMRSSLRDLEEGYSSIYNTIKRWPEVSESLSSTFRKKYKSIMFKSYLGNLQILNALRMLK